VSAAAPRRDTTHASFTRKAPSRGLPSGADMTSVGRLRGKVAVVVSAALSAVLAATGCGGSQTAAGNSNVQIQISAPTDGSSVTADRVTVRGTVIPADATVQILGRPAQVGNGVFTGSVPLHSGVNTIDVVASAAGLAPTSTTIEVTRRAPAGSTAHGARVRRAAPPLSVPSNCGRGLTAGAHTSCPFAENVRTTFEQSGSGILDVYSPTTGHTYRMYCTSGSPHVCTGGNGASVYFSSSGSTAYRTSDCGGGISVGPRTSCAFALNVRDEYYRRGGGWISVYSPITNRTYRMFCTDSSPHVCTGGNNAAVYFP